MRRVMKKTFWAMIMLGAAISTASCAGIMALGNTVQAAQEETALPALAVTMSKESGCYPDAFPWTLPVKGQKRFFIRWMAVIQ